MKKFRIHFAAVSTLLLCTAPAQAAPEACDSQGPGGMRGAAEGAMLGRMDADHNGSVSRVEFSAFYAKRFEELDANLDGKLTPEEVAVARPMAPPPAMGSMGPGTTHLDQRFDAADLNHDGGLDKSEAGGMPMLSMYFDEVDANHDGKVTRKEYFDAMPLLHRVKQEKADSL